MRRIFSFTLCLFILLSAATFADEGWIDLFDGETLDGWKQLGGEAKYEVVDGEIVGTSVPNTSNSFLCTEQTYGDFNLELEFRCSDPQ